MAVAAPTQDPAARGCGECRLGESFALPFTMAFQPIIDARSGRVFAQEALVRGEGGEPAGHILSQVTGSSRYGFDQACRVRAIELASRLGLPATGAALSINFLPNAVYNPKACISATLRTAARVQFPLDALIFEITEQEQVVDHRHLLNIIEEYKRMGFRTAIDDFGAGYSGLNLLAKFQPDLIKLDMELIRGIDGDAVRRAIVLSIVMVCRDLSIGIIAEGVETEAEYRALRDCGIGLFQGFLFAKPAFQALPVPAFPA
jgi:EAL domain-containing protein (putative c-di-GMP-specific phosphodiesterase class I)